MGLLSDKWEPTNRYPQRWKKSVAQNPPPVFGGFNRPAEPQLLAFDPNAFRIQAPPIMTVEELKDKFAHKQPAAD